MMGDTTDYKCAVCGKTLEMDIGIMGLQCRNCGSKIFVKKRPSIKKTIKAV